MTGTGLDDRLIYKVMSRRPLLLLILAILLCCQGWAAAMDDLRFAQAGLADDTIQTDTRTASASGQARQDHQKQQTHQGSGAKQGGSSGALNLDDTAIFGMADLKPVEVVMPASYRTSISGTLPFRWLERPMRPPRLAARLT